MFAKVAAAHAGRTAKRFFAAVECATAAQDVLLGQLLGAANGGEFARQHHFDRIRSYRDFVANVPIRKFADMADVIERVRQGDVRALFAPGEKILMFALTSGTTAQPKYIPITRRVLEDCRRGWNTWGLKALLDHPAAILRHIVQVASPMNDHAAPSGVPCGAITGLLAATQKRLVRRYYTSPPSVAQIIDPASKYYTIMRLAIPKDVAWLVTASPATLLALARTADEHKERLIRDIHDGTLCREVEVSGSIRAELKQRLVADRDRAKQLEAMVRQQGALRPRDYWKLEYVAHWTGGTMGLYRSQFGPLFGDVPVRDVGLIASEGRMSIPTEDGTAAGVLEVTSQFFEFIPAAEYGTAKPAVLRSHEVVEGEEYFVLLTNASGLYRYDVGDRVRVTGWMGQAPLIEFLSRDAHTSSLAGEKLTEDQVVLAMERACRGRCDAIVNFVLAPRWGSVPGYRLYIEECAARLLPDSALRLDVELCETNLEYASKRKTLRLGGIELAVVSNGALASRDFELKRTRSRTSEQFKHQYLLSALGADESLSGNVMTCENV